MTMMTILVGNSDTTSQSVAAETTAADKTNGLRWYYYALDEDAPGSDTESDCDLGSASGR